MPHAVRRRDRRAVGALVAVRCIHIRVSKISAHRSLRLSPASGSGRWEWLADLPNVVPLSKTQLYFSLSLFFPSLCVYFMTGDDGVLSGAQTDPDVCEFISQPELVTEWRME